MFTVAPMGTINCEREGLSSRSSSALLTVMGIVAAELLVEKPNTMGALAALRKRRKDILPKTTTKSV
jgi:hypothetical protein